MRYPKETAEDEWFILSRVAKRKEGGTRPSVAILVLEQQGFEGSAEIGRIDIKTPEAEQEWLKLLAQGVRLVEALNYQPIAGEKIPESLGKTGSCADCGKDISENDYLCENCREAQGEQLSSES